MLMNNRIVVGELQELADIAESAARRIELLLNWLPEESEARNYIDETRMKFRQAYERINSARFAIENGETEVAAMRER